MIMKAPIMGLLVSTFFNVVALHAFDMQSNGGSNYAWYDIDESQTSGNSCREPYGIIANYHVGGVRDTVKIQLVSMRDNRQEKLRIPIYHMRNPSGGTILNSINGQLQDQDEANLTLFLQDIVAAGFNELEVGFFPQGSNNPTIWDSNNYGWQETYFQENWNFIYRTHDVLEDAGISTLRIDLMNEGAPADNQALTKQYVTELWWNYNSIFGKSDTIGFSIGGADSDRYNNLVDALNETGYGLPYLWGIHIYEDLFDGNLEELDEHMSNANDSRSWVIGETFYDDQSVKEHFETSSIRRTIWHVYQWPLTSDRGCDGHVDVGVPVDFRYLGGSE